MAENAERLPAEVTNLCQMFYDVIDGLSDRIDELTQHLRHIARQNDVPRRLMTMPVARQAHRIAMLPRGGIGPVTAVSIAVLAAPPEMFTKGRDLFVGKTMPHIVF